MSGMPTQDPMVRVTANISSTLNNAYFVCSFHFRDKMSTTENNTPACVQRVSRKAIKKRFKYQTPTKNLKHIMEGEKAKPDVRRIL